MLKICNHFKKSIVFCEIITYNYNSGRKTAVYTPAFFNNADATMSFKKYIKYFRGEKMTNNKFILSWLNEMAEMTKPDKIVWIDGSEAQLEALRQEACAAGEIIKLNEELLPNSYLHRTAVNDVARVEDRIICTANKEDAGNINNWMDPKVCYEKLTKLYTGSMKGRTMYVIPIRWESSALPSQNTESSYRLHLCRAQHGLMTRIAKPYSTQ